MKKINKKNHTLSNTLSTNNTATKYESSINHTLLCCYLVFISLCYTQTCLPALPEITDSLSSSSSIIQLAFTINILAFGFSQILYGYYSDLYGRKNTLLIGLLITLLGNILCALSYTILMLFAGQLLIGIGAGACSVIPRTISRDIFSGNLLIKIITYMSIASTIATGIAPIIGGILQKLFGWRSIFIFLTILTILTLLLISYSLAETIKEKSHFFSIPSIKKMYIKILINTNFLMYATLNSLVYSSIIIYLILSPFILQKIFFFSGKQNSLIYLVCAIYYLIGNLVLPHLNKKLNYINIIGIGIIFILLGSIFITIPFHSLQSSFIKLMLCGIFIHLGSGLITPFTYKKILDIIEFPVGITAGAINSMRVFIAFIISIFATTYTTSNLSGLACILIILSLFSFAIYYFLKNKNQAEQVQI